MNLIKGDIERIQQTDIDALDPEGQDNWPVTWFKTQEGDYQVLSAYGDTVWNLGHRFAAGVKDSAKKLDFGTIPPAFQVSLKALVQRYDLSEKPAGSTLVDFFMNARRFMRYLADMGVTRLSDANTMHCANYVDHCRNWKSKRGKPLGPRTLVARFSVIEQLQRRASGTADAFPKPWPDASAYSLAGLSEKGGRRPSTLLIPDAIWSALFRAATERLDEADALFGVRDKLDGPSDQCPQDGLSERPTWHRRNAQAKEFGYQGLRDFESRYLQIESATMVVILSLSGIRVHELCYLQNDAWYVTENDGDRTYWLRSRSDKTGKGDTEWMVPALATQALDVAQRFAKPLQVQLEANRQSLIAADPHSRTAHALSADGEKLFLGKFAARGNRVAGLSAHSVLNHLNRFAAAHGIDWHFTPHQFRRTFARYVARSGLGDLRYLRAHFKHWGLDMTTLYAENERQDAELYDEIMTAVRHEHLEVITHWLDEDVLITGGCADSIRVFRTDNEALRTYENRRAMALRIANTVFIRATGAAWCTADDGGCGGRGAIEATRCGDCANSVIDDKNLRRWIAIYQQQLELRGIQGLGPAAEARVERDIQRCEQVLSDLGALKRVQEGLAEIAASP